MARAETTTSSQHSNQTPARPERPYACLQGRNSAPPWRHTTTQTLMGHLVYQVVRYAPKEFRQRRA